MEKYTGVLQSLYDISRLQVAKHQTVDGVYAICTDVAYVQSAVGTTGIVLAQSLLFLLILLLLLVNWMLWRRYTAYRRRHAVVLNAMTAFSTNKIACEVTVERASNGGTFTQLEAHNNVALGKILLMFFQQCAH